MTSSVLPTNQNERYTREVTIEKRLSSSYLNTDENNYHHNSSRVSPFKQLQLERPMTTSYLQTDENSYKSPLKAPIAVRHSSVNDPLETSQFSQKSRPIMESQISQSSDYATSKAS